jgi:anti-anti-sigma factor
MRSVPLTVGYTDSTAIVRLEGRLAASAELYRLKAKIDSAISARSSAALILNLAAVPDIDSSGLGELVSIHTSLVRRSIRVAFAEINPRIREMLELTRIDGLFTVLPDEKSALEYIAQSKVSDQTQQ